MSFASIPFILLLIFSFFVYYLIPRTYRLVFLLVVSAYFYYYLNAPYLFIPLTVVILSSYWGGLQIARNERRRKRVFITAVALQVLTLLFFRFYPVLLDLVKARNPEALAAFPFQGQSALSAVGVSFFVFQGIAYLVDIYWEKSQPERNLGRIALFFSFFPKLLQGPIERGGSLLPQLQEPGAFSVQNARTGFLLFAYGLFKKVVIADRLAELVNPAFADLHSRTGLTLLAVVYLFSFQIYYDFSGYTDMALGAARIFNIHLTPNFNLPYLASNIQEFWQRWHMSFSRWIMDYLFYPIQLRLRRHGKTGVVIALLATFLLSGLWHGAAWGYLIWGLLHGVYLSAAVFITPAYKRFKQKHHLQKALLPKMLEIFATFNLVALAWVFFRADRVGDALEILNRIFSTFFSPGAVQCAKTSAKYLLNTVLKGPDQWQQYLGLFPQVCSNFELDLPLFPGKLQYENIAIFLASIFIIVWLGIWGRRMKLESKPALLRWAVYAVLLFFMLLSGLFLETSGSSSLTFLYFRY